MNKVIIGLGSNINPEKNIAQSRAILAERFKVLGSSQFIQTKPVGYTEQDDFINGSLYIETDLSLEELTAILKNIEKEMGRKKIPIKYGPRSIDLDIAVWNGQIIDQDFYERDFIKNAVLELVPDLQY